MPRKGYKQTEEHKAKRAAAISVARNGRRHSKQTRAAIGEGVKEAAEQRRVRDRAIKALRGEDISDTFRNMDAKRYLYNSLLRSAKGDHKVAAEMLREYVEAIEASPEEDSELRYFMSGSRRLIAFWPRDRPPPPGFREATSDWTPADSSR